MSTVNKRRRLLDKLFAAAITAAIVAILALSYHAWRQCDGTLVRGVVWWVCVP